MWCAYTYTCSSTLVLHTLDACMCCYFMEPALYYTFNTPSHMRECEWACKRVLCAHFTMGIKSQWNLLYCEQRMWKTQWLSAVNFIESAKPVTHTHTHTPVSERAIHVPGILTHVQSAPLLKLIQSEFDSQYLCEIDTPQNRLHWRK